MMKIAGHVLIFDSGVGGLSVAAEIRAHNPELRLSYVADDIFRPYGAKTEGQLKARLPRLLWELTEMLRPDCVVIACNTASTTALAEIRAVLNIPVIGVVPAVKPAAKISRTKTIAVLGTPGTVQRRYVDTLIHEHASGCHVRLLGSVKLVDMAEAKLAGAAVDTALIRAELAPLFGGRHGANVDVVVLACTHFPLLKTELKAAAPQSVQWIDSGKAIAKRLETVMRDLKPKISDKPFPETAFLMGREISEARQAAFAAFGFSPAVTLISL